MLLKKIGVLLIGLVTTVVLACGIPAASAADFSVSLDTSADIGAADGLQLPYPANNTLLVVLFFSQSVVLETSHLQTSGYDANNTYDPAIVLAATYPVWPITASRSFRISITVTPGTSRVSLQVNAGIPSADPINTDTSLELTADIGLLDTTRDVTTAPEPTITGVTPGTAGTPVPAVTPGGTRTTQTVVGSGPKVYDIRRDPPSALPLTGGAVSVVITLSEAAQGLSATHINVTNGTAGAPVALGATAQDTVGLDTVATHLISTGAIAAKPPLRTAAQLMTDIITYMNDTAGQAPAEFIENVRALKTAVSAIGSPWRYYFLDASGTLGYVVLWDGATTYYMLTFINDAVPPPTTQGTVDITVATPVALTITAEQFNRSEPELPVPNVTDYATVAEYNFAVARSNAWNGSSGDTQRAAYTAEKLVYDRYMDLQRALQAYDVRQQVEWDTELAMVAANTQQVPQSALPPTGRDNMLHRYSVAITPTYATDAPVVVKVNQFPNTNAPPLYYTPPVLESGYVEGFDKFTLQIGAGAVVVPEPKDVQVIGVPEEFGFVFAGAPGSFTALDRDQIQEYIDLLIATGDQSPEAMRILAYLQQLFVTARPEKTQLLANYPNPFNPETWIPYELATDTEVRVTIYNTHGVVIRSLGLGHQSAGYYTGRDRAAYWDGRNALGEQVASGIYFYQLETDKMSLLRKMLILK